MTIRAELHDGRVLEFPDGTDPSVIQATVKKMLGGEQQSESPSQSDIIKERVRSISTGKIPAESERQRSLAARYLIEGSLGLADLAATPFRLGLNAIAPNTFDARTGGQAIADIAGLPMPSTDLEKSVAVPSETLAAVLGGGAASRALTDRVVPGVADLVRTFGENPVSQSAAAIGSGVGVAAADRAGVGPWGQLAAGLAGGMIAPAGVAAARYAGEVAGDIGATVGASFGSTRGRDRLIADAVDRGLGTSRASVKSALKQPTEYVKGAKPTAAQTIAEANMKTPGKVSGGWLARLEKDLTGAPGVEDVLPSNTAAQNQALVAAKKALDAKTAPLRTAAIERVDAAGGVDARRLSKSIYEYANTPEVVGNPSAKRAALALMRWLDDAQSGGKISAKTLYEFRKKGLGDAVAKAAQTEGGVVLTPSESKNIANGYISRRLQGIIDDSIAESGAGGLWKKYLGTYSKGMRTIDAHEARVEKAADMAKSVKPLSGQIAPGEVPKAPTLLNRKMMFANWFMQKLGSNANDPVVKEITRALKDPDEFAKILQRPAKDPVRIALSKAIRAGEDAAHMAVFLNNPQLGSQQ